MFTSNIRKKNISSVNRFTGKNWETLVPGKDLFHLSVVIQAKMVPKIRIYYRCFVLSLKKKSSLLSEILATVCAISSVTKNLNAKPGIEKEGQESKISSTLQQPSTSCLSFSSQFMALNRRGGNAHKPDRKTERLVVNTAQVERYYSPVLLFLTLVT